MLISVNNSSICELAPRLSILTLEVLMFYCSDLYTSGLKKSSRPLVFTSKIRGRTSQFYSMLFHRASEIFSLNR